MTDDAVLKPHMPIDLEVLYKSYGWTIDVDGQVCGLVAGDMGYDETGIVIPMDHILAVTLKAHEKIEDTPGYKAGFASGINKAAMLHVVHANGHRRVGSHVDAETHMGYAKRIRELGKE